MKKYARGIFIGKFYPLHLGHLETLSKLVNECEESYLIFYHDSVAETRLASELGAHYSVQQRVLDAEDATKDLGGVSVKSLDVPSDITFPKDFLKIKTMVKELTHGEADVQIFGTEEESVYLPYKYADNYLLGPQYDVINEEGDSSSLHATAIRKSYSFYRKYLPVSVQKSLDSLKNS